MTRLYVVRSVVWGFVELLALQRSRLMGWRWRTWLSQRQRGWWTVQMLLHW